ncbi:hypothetical protein KV47_08005 [Staphylococcus haemolyticus]|uniref:Uncharacterized protein n=2 Tax=Staphylococcus haemolyticus TaxID=1283 RepID=Q4L3M3_STAHJ|nr:MULTISPECIES: hypothetical protein [Staphylococcus]TKW61036.1 MAG: hypothetical protein DI638_10205 [Gemella sp.]AMW22615.1 hypothetical protein AV904_01285 [Staphylococcus haemolyticus]EZI34081.1 hypothetical protein BW32_01800 [Staphylococcus haemolyticus]MBC3014551.1 hypothetical protein [Staphylococcus haemolyticus]MBC3115761.1 hypothetical protein [Staphylococcus haemolyticus]
MFLKREKKYKKYQAISKSILGFSVLLLILTWLLNLVFGWSILHLFFNIFSFTFILGLCIGAIPDILEKDVNTILADILVIILMIVVLFIL